MTNWYQPITDLIISVSTNTSHQSFDNFWSMGQIAPQQWLVWAPMGIQFEPINKELMRI